LSEATPEKNDEQQAQDAPEAQAADKPKAEAEAPVEATAEAPAEAEAAAEPKADAAEAPVEATAEAPAEAEAAAEPKADAAEAPAEAKAPAEPAAEAKPAEAEEAPAEPEVAAAPKRGARTHAPASRERGGGGRRGRRDDSGGDSRGDGYENVVKIFRSAAVVKGGRRFSFAALTVVGDRNGKVGIGYGKANGVPNAVEKSFKKARRSLQKVTLSGHTLPHEVTGRYLASRVFMRPAAPGTGIIAGAAVRAVVEAAGVRDILTKAYGSTSAKNLVKAALQGLQSLRDRATVEQLRGVELE
jgi:small subunit ribosomal protein S5